MEPKIRFKGFEGEWRKAKLGDIATFSKGSGYSKSDLCKEGSPMYSMDVCIQNINQ